MTNLEGTDPADFDAAKMDATDRWILSRLNTTIGEVSDALEGFKFSDPMNQIYRFFWNDLCDWYLEWAKPKMRDPQRKAATQNVLAFVLDQTLRLLHPFLPFITEGIFKNLNEIVPKRRLTGLVESPPAKALVVAQWPETSDSLIDSAVEVDIDLVQTTIRTIRELRSSRNIPPGKKLVVSAKTPAAITAVLSTNLALVEQLANLETFAVSVDMEKPDKAAVAVAGAIEVYVHDAVDPAAERIRLEKQKQLVEKGLWGVEGKLNNEQFRQRAKPEVVEQTQQKRAELQEQLATVDKHLAELN
jgi:valyl-tRNA synthetase